MVLVLVLLPKHYKYKGSVISDRLEVKKKSMELYKKGDHVGFTSPGALVAVVAVRWPWSAVRVNMLFCNSFTIIWVAIDVFIYTLAHKKH